MNINSIKKQLDAEYTEMMKHQATDPAPIRVWFDCIGELVRAEYIDRKTYIKHGVEFYESNGQIDGVISHIQDCGVYKTTRFYKHVPVAFANNVRKEHKIKTKKDLYILG